MKKSLIFLFGVMLVLGLICEAPVQATDFSKWQPLQQNIRVGPDSPEIQPAKANKPYLIGMTIPHVRDPYWIALAYGAFDEAEKLGVELRFTAAGGYGKIPVQVRQIQDFVVLGANAIIVGAVDYEGPGQAMDEAWRKGIPVVNCITWGRSEQTPGIITDDRDAGVLQARYMGKEMPNAKVVMLNGPAGTAWAKARADAFIQTCEKEFPGIEILASKYFQMDRVVSKKNMEDCIQAFPKIDFVYNATDLQAKGCVDALRTAGKKPGEVRVTTLTIGREAYAMMKEGWIDYAIAERPVFEGRGAIRMAVKILNGEKVAKTWTVIMPGYSKEELDKFDKVEKPLNWEPDGWKVPQL